MQKYTLLNPASYLIFLLIAFSAVLLPGQSLLIEDGTIMHEDGPRACIRVEVEPDTKAVKKAWEDYLKDNFDVKLKGLGFLTNKDILYAKAVEFPEVSPKVLDFYTRVIEQGDRTEMCVFAALGNDIYLNKEVYPLEYSRLQKIVESFLGEYLPDHYGDLVKEVEDQLEDMQDQQKELSDDIADNKREIAKLEKENRKMSKELIDVQGAIKDLKEKLELRRDKLNRIDRQVANR